MALFIVLGVVVLMTFIVLGFLFFMLDKEGQKEEEKAVPVTDLSQLRREVSAAPQAADPQAANYPICRCMSPMSLPTQIFSRGRMFIKNAPKNLKKNYVAFPRKQRTSQEARKMIEDLTKENESLKSQQADLIQAQEKLVELQKETDHLQTENTTLQTQLDSSHDKVRLLEEEMAAVKIQMGEEIAQAKARYLN